MGSSEVQGDVFRRLAGNEKAMRALVYVLLFLITLPMLTKVFTSDFGTHIAIGRQIVRTMSIPEKEFLNYPSLGTVLPNGEWGFQAVLYLVFSAFGVYGVSFMCWAIVFAIYLFIHRATVLRGANPLVAIAAIFAFSGFLRIRIQPRPEIFTYLFIAATIYMFTEFYFGKRKRLAWFFPLLILAWANMHPTYLMGFVLCGAFFVDALVRAAWKRELQWGRVRSWAVPAAVAGFAGLVACGLNPHGYDAIMAPLHVISRGGGGGSDPHNILMSISELTPVKGTGMFVYYKAAIVFAAVSLLLGAVGRRVYLLDIMLFAIAFKGSWDSARAVSMMGLFLSPGASLQLTGFLEKVGSRSAAGAARIAAERAAKEAGRKKEGPREKARDRRAERKATPEKVQVKPGRRPWGKLTAAAAVSVALIVFGSVTLSFSFSQLEYGVGLTEHKFSMKAAEFLRHNPIRGNMFNFFDIGGFLDWQLYPQALTFLDGRTYNPKVFTEHQVVTGGMPGWDDILRRYGITYIVIKTMDSSGTILPLVEQLANDPGWQLVFADGLFVVFVKDSPENRDILARYAIPKSAIPQQVIMEAYHYMFLGVSPLMAYNTMSNMYQLMGNMPAAIQSLKTALEYSDEPFIRAQLANLEQRHGTR